MTSSSTWLNHLGYNLIGLLLVNYNLNALFGILASIHLFYMARTL